MDDDNINEPVLKMTELIQKKLRTILMKEGSLQKLFLPGIDELDEDEKLFYRNIDRFDKTGQII